MQETTKMYMVVDFKPTTRKYFHLVVIKYMTVNEIKAREYAEDKGFYFYDMKQVICFNETKEQVEGKSIHRIIKYDNPCEIWTKQTISPVYIEDLQDFGIDFWCSLFYEYINDNHYLIPMEEPIEISIGEVCYSDKPLIQLEYEDDVNELMMDYVCKRLGEM